MAHRDTVRQDLQAKGWIVRDGTLYGGDFVLYSRSESEYHSHSVYLVKVYDESFKNRDVLCSMRICNSVCKKLLIAQATSGCVKYYSVTSI